MGRTMQVHSFDEVDAVVDFPEKRRSPGPPQNLIDVGPTDFRHFGTTIPGHVQGQPIPNFRPPSSEESPAQILPANEHAFVVFSRWRTDSGRGRVVAGGSHHRVGRIGSYSRTIPHRSLKWRTRDSASG